MSWIKIRTDLHNHPKVVRMASALKTDRLRILGGLQVVWSAFDTHSEDGLLEGYTLAALDEQVGLRGFAGAMTAVKWLSEIEAGLEVPEFDEHNGASAKKRAQDTKLKKSNREPDKTANKSWTPGGQMSGDEPDKKRSTAGPEKELDKRLNTPLPPKGGTVHGFPPGFDAFWSRFPKKVAKQDAAKAFAALKANDALQATILAALERQKASVQWAKDDGQFVPNAATWLRGRRWEDDCSTAPDAFEGAL